MISILKTWSNLLSIEKIYFNIHVLSQGDCILVSYRQNPKIYIITKGSIKLSKVFDDTNQLTFAILREDDLLSILDTERNSKNYYYSAEALSSTIVISYNYLQLPKQQFIMNYKLLIAQRRYICKLNDIIQILSHQNKKNRLVNLLLILCKEFGILTKVGIVINLVITHKTLSIIVGSSRNGVTTALKLLQRNRLISIYKKKILIHDPISLSLYYTM